MTRKTRPHLITGFALSLAACLLLYAFSFAFEPGNRHHFKGRHLRPWQPEHRRIVPPAQELGTVTSIARALEFSDDVTTALVQLSSETVFATGLIGEAAAVPASEAQFRLLMQQPSATDIFLVLFYASGSTNEGRMQALRGLWHVNPAAYAEIVSSIRNSDILITTVHGCIVESVTVAEVLTEIETLPLVQWHTLAYLNRYTMRN